MQNFAQTVARAVAPCQDEPHHERRDARMGTISEDGIYWRGQQSRPDVVEREHIEEPARSIPIFCECDVLVVGGGPSGTAAAVSAARAGAKVVLLERHNHL